MKKKVRMALTAVLAIGLVVGLAGVVRHLLDYWYGEQDYAAAEEVAGVTKLTTPPAKAGQTPLPAQSGPEGEPVDRYADALSNVDFAALQEVNSDVMGWIAIPNSDLSYPLLQGEDNDYYLDYTWQKSRNSVGAIFLDYRNSGDLDDFNSVIYGHRMNTSAMFGYLHHYAKEGYWEEHPNVYIAHEDGVYLYEVFAFYETGTMATYSLSFADDAEKQEFIDTCLEQSDLDTGIVPDVNDHIITMSTCTGSGHATRWVVQAVRQGEAEPDPAVE